MLTRIRSENPV